MKKSTKTLLWWTVIGGGLGFAIYSLAQTGKAAKAVLGPGGAVAPVAPAAPKAQGNYIMIP